MKNHISKRYKKFIEASDKKKVEIIDDAIKKVKKNCTTKFNESIDVSCFLNLKRKKEMLFVKKQIFSKESYGMHTKEIG